MVLESAAKLQQAVPDAVLIGGSAAALYAGHWTSFHHDHVLPDLIERYQVVLEACEATEGWATNVRASTPPYTILGTLGGIEAGLRQLRRTRPLEVVAARLPSARPFESPRWPRPCGSRLISWCSETKSATTSTSPR